MEIHAYPEDSHPMEGVPSAQDAASFIDEDGIPFFDRGVENMSGLGLYAPHSAVLQQSPLSAISGNPGLWPPFDEDFRCWEPSSILETPLKLMTNRMAPQWNPAAPYTGVPDDQSSGDESYTNVATTPMDHIPSPDSSVAGVHDAPYLGFEYVGPQGPCSAPYFGEGVHMQDIQQSRAESCHFESNMDPSLQHYSKHPSAEPFLKEHSVDVIDVKSEESRIYVQETKQTRTPSPSDSGSDYCPAGKRKVKSPMVTHSGKGSKSHRAQSFSGKAKCKSAGVSKRAAPRRANTDSHKAHQNASSSSKHACSQCSAVKDSAAELQRHIKGAHERPFACTFSMYGCPAKFGAKNEWKRHVASQHLRPGIWRCDLPGCQAKPATPAASTAACYSPSPGRSDTASVIHVHSASDVAEVVEMVYNDFNRKDLFTQHLKRMHSDEVAKTGREELDKQNWAKWVRMTSDRCLSSIRGPPPRSVCGFCAPVGGARTVFEGSNGWEQRMEHVGKHLEGGADASTWIEDVDLRTWLYHEGLLQRNQTRAWQLSALAGMKEYRGR